MAVKIDLLRMRITPTGAPPLRHALKMPSRSKDLTGYELTCSTEEALNWFNKAVFAYTTVRENGLPFFDKSLEKDSSIVLAHCVLVIN